MVRKIARIVGDYLVITIGVALMAIAFDCLMIPNKVVSGGVVGVAQLLNTLWRTPVGMVSLLINVPLFFLGWRYLGGRTFGVRTFYATVLLSVLVDGLMPWVQEFIVTDTLLYVVYGGLIDGIGLALVLRARGTTGGVDILARLLQRWRGIPPGQGILVINVLVFAAAGWIYGLKPVLYAVLLSFIATWATDTVLDGFSYARSALIISNEGDAIRQAILQQLGRGVTVLSGQGGYSATERPVLLCVISLSEVSHLKALIATIDPAAFVIIGEAKEVVGEGFKGRWVH